MRITWQMDYLNKDPKTGIYRYRRRVPKEVQPTVGKREIIHSFKMVGEAIALKSYKAVHAKAEATLGKELRRSCKQIVYEARWLTSRRCPVGAPRYAGRCTMGVVLNSNRKIVVAFATMGH